jgi:single-strand DNA-binding protein
MASFNKVILIGNLTRDPELRYTPKGTANVRIGLAVNRKYKDANGQLQEEVSFIDADAWSQQAETIAQYMRKGNPMLVEGRLKQDSWDDKQTGQKRTALRVVIENFQFLGGGQRPADQAGPASAPAASSPRPVRAPAPAVQEPSAPEHAAPSDDGDDVPF